jgi:hypothetical protein
LLFQTLDDKNECVGIYIDGDLHFHQPLPDNLTETWAYSGFLKGLQIEYANLYCEGKPIEEVCPDHLKEDWQLINKKLKSIISACFESKVSLKENCFFDLTPKRFLIEFCYLRNEITKHVLQTHKKPLEYEFYKRFNELLHDIKYRDLKINLDNIQNKLGSEDALAFYRKINNGKTNISYNMFGSVTGRLTTTKNSFPILTFPKQYREILEPENDWFVVFDMNAAELRTALALAGKSQISGDLHEWSAENVFKGQLDRSGAKSMATAWLYDSHSEQAAKYDAELSDLYDKQGLLDKYWIDGKVHTPYNRIIEADKHHAISYLNQSTFIDLFHRQIIKVDDYLKGKKSFISFLIHDEFVLDVSEAEKNHILEIAKILQNTPYGVFPVNIKVGRNYGTLKKLNLKVNT